MNTSLTLDVFNADGFSNATLTGWVNEHVPYVPGLIGSLPEMFKGQGVYTPAVQFDDRNGTLSLIQSSARGAPASQSINSKGTIRTLNTVRLAREAAILADQVANVRVLGNVGELQTAERLVQQRIEGPWGLKANLGVTMEHLFLGTVNGQAYDADGTTLLWDYFVTYGVSRPAAVNVAFSTLTSDGGVFAMTLVDAKRTMVRALNGLSLASAIPVVLCGDNYYDAAWSNKEAVSARKTGAFGAGKNEAISQITDSNAFDSFVFNKVLFINYRGTDDGAVSVPTDEGFMFMTGVPGLFPVFFAPADTWDFVNTEGLPSYLIQRLERQTSSQRTFEVQANPLPMCMRPLHLLQMTKS